MGTKKTEVEEALLAAEKKRLEEARAAEVERIKTQLAEGRLAASQKDDAEFRTACDKLYKTGERIIEDGQRGYDTWVAAMSSAVLVCRDILEMNPGGRALGGLARLASEKFLGGWSPRSSIDGKLAESSVRPVGEPTLPELKYFVEFTPDNKLNFPSLTKNIRLSNGQALTPELETVLQKSMEKGVVAWLDLKGFELKPGTKDQFVSKLDHTTPLDKATFEGLRDRLSADMNKHLSDTFNVRMGHAPVEEEEPEPDDAPTPA